MWNPKPEGVKELLNLFAYSKCNDNCKQKEVYYKINEYSRNTEFSNYLIYILNEESIEIDTRQISGLTLKGMLEREFNNINDINIEYFKSNILKNYLHPNQKIRKTISILLNTFLRQGGIEIWPELLEFLFEKLDNENCVETSLETLNFIFEDSGSNMERKFEKFIQKYVQKLLNSLQTTHQNIEENQNTVILVLTSIEVLTENCANTMMDMVIVTVNVLLNLHQCKNLTIRYKIGRCWMAIIRIKPEMLSICFDQLFAFFFDNLSIEQYELNFNSAEFFNLLIEDENNTYLKFDNIFNKLRHNMKNLLLRLMHFMTLTKNDLCGLENTFKTVTQFSPKSENFLTVEENKQPEEYVSDSYNPNTTLRKLCARTMDRLSNILPSEVFLIVKESLEKDMKNHDWLTRERSILALGAIGKGSYEYLKQHLPNLIQFLINELQNPNKPVRAISCWTISRFSSFIMIDNLTETSNELFKSCLAEILKRIMDTEPMVQEAACSTFSNMIATKKEKLEPYLHEIFQVLSSIFDKYKGNSMLNLYDIICFMTEEYQEHFKNKDLAEPLIKCVIQKWSSTNNQDYNNMIPTIEVLGSIVRVSGSLISNYCLEFYNRSLNIIEEIISNYKQNNNDLKFLDKEMISKIIDFISILSMTHSDKIKVSVNNGKIMDILMTLISSNDYEIKHYVFALFGDLAKSHPSVLLPYFNEIMLTLINHLECPPSVNKYDSIEMAKLHVCNNTCWTVGLLANSYPEYMSKYVESIMVKLLKILCVTRVLFHLCQLNKSLAQNVSICIGRLGIGNPEKISKFIDSFLKQFCLSLRVIHNSIEKQDAFTGLCQSILFNPNGVINHFAYFCDAICNYDNAPVELDTIFHKLMHSYKTSLNEKWVNYFKSFPSKLQKKMIYRFKIE